jgi:GDP-L-fucose synthase
MADGLMTFDISGKRIWVSGHTGLVGTALTARLRLLGGELITASHQELDLTNQQMTHDFVSAQRLDAVIIGAAVVGGIQANAKFPTRFLQDNLQISTNIISASHAADVTKLVFLGSSCIYPRLADQPVSEASLLTGPLEPTNEWYAISKIAGLKLCQAYRQEFGADFITAIPANLYGPGDNFDPDSGHVVSALINRIHQARLAQTPFVEIWGSGNPTRDFFYVDDCIDGLIHVLKHYFAAEPINMGTGREVSIRELAQTISEVIGYEGDLVYDSSKPDGMPRKILDTSRINAMGWQSKTDLRSGLDMTYQWFLENVNYGKPE